ncbi:phosphoribosylamine--glycine ligase [Candidatus Peregrinibacteria bacterium]|nr:phosphoribosylamine--glycine ligase [Candidatus Peregrinibacteria bacterium]
MNILLLGNGAREHVLANLIKKSRHQPKLFVYASAKNPGIYKMAEEYYIGDICDTESVCEFAKTNNITLAIIGPENPLDAGIVDELRKVGIDAFAPTKALAQLETSKGFTRNLLEKYGVKGNPGFRSFSSVIPAEAGIHSSFSGDQPKAGKMPDQVRHDNELLQNKISNFLDELSGEYVIKYDALLGGKGVKLSGEHLHSKEEGVAYAMECLEECGKVVIEEKLVGEEFSLISLVDGETVLDFPAAQDHKRAYVGDTGPNTGGMGTYSDADHLLPFITQKDRDEAHKITVETMKAIEKECGEKYKGVMYGGFIVTKNGVRLIEYNARFGDPEAMNLLSILKTDFVDLCLAGVEGKLSKMKLECENLATVCKYVVPEGYPDKPLRGERISLKVQKSSMSKSQGENSSLKTYYAAVDEKEGKLIMTGSRAIAFVGLGENIEEAEKIAQAGVESVEGKVFYREDIGTKELIQKRIDHMEKIRG